ncbi:MAG: hypothetical protein L3J39_05880 [Verrucomicrobiales bacterium]|nr:hypothetical protein [Verrucomicrobiales bacterium]
MKNSMNAAVMVVVLIVGITMGEASCQDFPKSKSKWAPYEYAVEMPSFMEDCPSLGSDVGGIFWEWSSREGDVRVAHTFLVQSWQKLKTPSAMNSAVDF